MGKFSYNYITVYSYGADFKLQEALNFFSSSKAFLCPVCFSLYDFTIINSIN